MMNSGMMSPEEYDKLHRSNVPLVTEEVAGDFSETTLIPRVTVINSTPQDMYQQEMTMLQEGGADYEGREEITGFMRGLGRLCGG